MNKNGSHYIVSFLDKKNRLLDFERISLKTAIGSYKSVLKFIKKYGLDRYEACYNTYDIYEQPEKIEVSFQEYEPSKNTIIFEKTYDEFLEDLANL